MARTSLLLLVLLPVVSSAAPITITSSQRTLNAQTSASAGAFSVDESFTYITQDGNTVTVDAYQFSDISETGFLLSTSSRVRIDDIYPVLTVDREAMNSTFDVTFDVPVPVHFVLTWDEDQSCEQHLCDRFDLFDVGSAQAVFFYEGGLYYLDGSNNVGGKAGTFEADLAPGNYRFHAHSFSNWGSVSREYSGGTLDLSLAFSGVPEPSALAMLLGPALALGLAARSRRR